MTVKISVFGKDMQLIKKIEVTKEDRLNKILKREKSLLDLALDKDVLMNYGCMGGSCSACKCILLKGKEYINNEGVGKQIYEDVDKNEILTCIAILKEDTPDDAEIELQFSY